jgi:hypothetical protein
MHLSEDSVTVLTLPGLDAVTVAVHCMLLAEFKLKNAEILLFIAVKLFLDIGDYVMTTAHAEVPAGSG